MLNIPSIRGVCGGVRIRGMERGESIRNKVLCGFCTPLKP